MIAIDKAEEPSRNTFAFYWSFKDAIRDMSDSDKLAIYESITDFAFFGVEPDGLAPVGRLAWKLIRPQLEASIRRYDACKINGQKGAEYGSMGGRPRKGNPNMETPIKTPDHNPKENPLNHNDNVNHNHNDNKKGVVGGNANAGNDLECARADQPRKVATKRAAFVAPTLEELCVFVSEEKLANVNPDEFIDHYTANGWRAGKNPMKDWKAAARNWNRRSREFTSATANQANHEARQANFL